MGRRIPLAIIIGSTREGRFGPRVADWCSSLTHEHGAFTVKDFELGRITSEVAELVDGARGEG